MTSPQAWPLRPQGLALTGRYGLPMGQSASSQRLPGEEIVHRGLRDLEDGVESVESLLVSIGAPRLRRLELEPARALAQPEERLYLLLRQRHGDAAHSRYNALVRRLVSFERAAATVGVGPHA